jgi:N-acetylgalactosamine-6-sulfatase
MRMTVYAWMLTFGFMTASCVYPFCKIRASENAAPNVILILVDDLGYSDVGCMGATDIATPNIDRLASEGVRFTDFYANAPVCSPTRAALITGRWQQRSGIEWAIGLTSEEERRVDEQYVRESEPFQFGLAAEEPSLAMILKQKNYGTAAFGKWHLGFRPEFNPVRHGFDEYFGIGITTSLEWRSYMKKIS